MLSKDDLEKYSKSKWFNYRSFYDKISSIENYKTFIEIGVWKGSSLIYLADKLKNREGVEIFAVDLFDDSYLLTERYLPMKNVNKEEIGHIWEIYDYNLKKHNVRHLITDIKDESSASAIEFSDNYFDFIFIDADHNQAKKDIEAWYPKLKQDGIIAGHDYGCYEAVRKDVTEFFKDKKGLSIFPCEDNNNSVWEFRK